MAKLLPADPVARRVTRLRLCLYAAALLVSPALVAADLGLSHYGLPSDEAIYHEAAQRHVEGLGQLLRGEQPFSEIVPEHFDWRSDIVIHPPVSRWPSGFSWWLLHRSLGFHAIYAQRLPHALFYGLLVLGIVIAASRWSLWAGLAALLLSFTDVRLFGHAHTAMPDLPLTCLWLWTTLLVSWGVGRRSLRLIVCASIAAGLVLGTKLTGLILVLLILPWPILVRGRDGIPSTALLLVVPPLVATAINPSAWLEPTGWWADTLATFSRRSGEAPIPTFFLGVVYGFRVPPYVPIVHALVTTPLVHLALSGVAALHGLRFLLGGRVAIRSWLASPWPLWLAAGFAPLAAVSLPGTPAHDLERLFLPMHPILILAGARGFFHVANYVGQTWSGSSSRRGQAMCAAVACFLFVPALAISYRQHPYELSYFNAIVGGPKGAEKLGFDVAYLKLEANAEVLDVLNTRLPPDARVFANFLAFDLDLHQSAGRLRSDIRLEADPLQAEFFITHARRSWMKRSERVLWSEPELAVWRLTHRGVDLVRLYARKALLPDPAAEEAAPSDGQ